jgi:peroxiredoxin
MLHLIGRQLPDVKLTATNDVDVMPKNLRGWVTYFIYPYTGRPEVPNPPAWDIIQGAHGSTPQALGYSMCYEDFQKRNIKVFGLSLQTTDWQKEFTQRVNLRIELLSDKAGEFSTQLGLTRFETGGQSYLSRVTLLTQDAVIRHIRYPVTEPEDDAKHVLTWFDNRVRS